MLQRVGISMNDEELRHLKVLQKRFGVRSRSELFRELVRRYEDLEKRWNSLNQCIEGYLKAPEAAEDAKSILRTTMKAQPHESW